MVMWHSVAAAGFVVKASTNSSWLWKFVATPVWVQFPVWVHVGKSKFGDRAVWVGLFFSLVLRDKFWGSQTVIHSQMS